MKNYRKCYKENIDKAIKMSKSDLLIHIGFYQHERLIHLLVTITFAVLTFLCFAILILDTSILKLVLFLIFFIMLVFYIIYYFYLENLVQKLYVIYNEKNN